MSLGDMLLGPAGLSGNEPMREAMRAQNQYAQWLARTWEPKPVRKPKVILYPPATPKGLWWAVIPRMMGSGHTMGEAIRDLHQRLSLETWHFALGQGRY